VAVGGDTTRATVWFSADGLAWERIPYDPRVFGGTTMKAVIPWGRGYLAAGPEWAMTAVVGGPYPGYPFLATRPTAWWSPDGRSWYRIPLGASEQKGTLRALAGFGGMVFAGGQNGVFMTGTDEDAIWVNAQPPEPGGQ